MAKNKPYEIPLEPDLASEILAHPSPEGERPAYPPTIGGTLAAAIDAVDEANEFLKTSTLARIVAENLARVLRKRGHASIRVRPDGTVVLHVSYKEEDSPDVKPEVPVQRSSRKSSLPTLDELREWASRMDVDIAGMGRARRAIYERLVKAEQGQPQTVPEPPKVILRKKAEKPADPEPDPYLEDMLKNLN